MNFWNNWWSLPYNLWSFLLPLCFSGPLLVTSIVCEETGTDEYSVLSSWRIMYGQSGFTNTSLITFILTLCHNLSQLLVDMRRKTSIMLDWTCFSRVFYGFQLIIGTMPFQLLKWNSILLVHLQFLQSQINKLLSQMLQMKSWLN